MTVYEINVFRSEPDSVGKGYAAPRVPLLDMKTESSDLAAMNLQMLAKKMMAEPAEEQPGAVVAGVLKEIYQELVDTDAVAAAAMNLAARKYGVTL